MKDRVEMKCLWFYVCYICRVSAASFMSVQIKLSIYVEENNVFYHLGVFMDSLTSLKLKLISPHIVTSTCGIVLYIH